MTLSDATQALLAKAFEDEGIADESDAAVATQQQKVIDAQNALANEQGNLNTQLQASSAAHEQGKQSAMAALRAIATELKIDLPA